jgi:UrcA family protein
MKAQMTSTHRANVIAIAIFGALALVSAVRAMAADAGDVRQTVVRFGDLNLSSPRGAAALYNRIAVAAREVCDASDVDGRDLGTRAVADACVQQAISGAVTKVGRSELFAIYNAKNSPPLGLTVASVEKR